MPPETDYKIKTIIKIMCMYYGVQEHEILSKCRTEHIASIRQVTCYLIRKFTDVTWQATARSVNLTTHGAAFHAFEAVTDRMEVYIEFRRQVDFLEMKCREALSITRSQKLSTANLPSC